MTQLRGVKGVWVAYHPDRSELLIFNSEIEMLRTAVAQHMQAGFWPFGAPFSEVERSKLTLPEPLPLAETA